MGVPVTATFTVTTLVVLAVLGFAVGAFGTVVGAGGGFILTPVLLILYPGDPASTITAISLVVVFFNALSGSAAYARQRRIDYRSGIVFALCTLPGAIGGTLLVQFASRRLFDAITAIVLGALAVWIMVAREADARTAIAGGGSIRHLVDRDGNSYTYSVRVMRGALLSLGVGFVSSFLGIGGGVIHVPLMVGFLGFPVHVATATSHFVLAVMSGASSLVHVLLGSFSIGHGLRRSVALSLGVVFGAQLGALASRHIGGRRIRQLLAVGLLVLAARLAIAVL